MNRLTQPVVWTDLSDGATRQEIQKILQFQNGVTIHFDNQPVAVILSVEKYALLIKEVTGVLDS